MIGRQGWGLAAVYALRDLRGGINGFRVFIACLMIGVGAIALVGSVSKAIVTGLENDGRKLLGGDVALRITHRGISEEQKAWLRKRGTVSEIISMRSMARGNTGIRTLINIKAVDNLYPLYGGLVLSPNLSATKVLRKEAGVWGAAVNPIILDRLGAKIGDTVSVGNSAFQIRAIIEAEPDPLGGVRGITLGPRFLIADKSLPDTGLVQEGAQITWEYRLRLPPQTDLKLFREELNTAFPDPGWRVRDRTTATLGIERFLKRTTQFVTLVAFTALLIGGVGVGNSTRSYMAAKTGMIATLKCLGAPQSLIFRLFFIQIALMGVVGTLLGVLLGAILPVIFATSLSQVLPLPIEVGFYPVPLTLATSFGLLTASAFTVWPLAGACQTSAAALFRSLISPIAKPNGFGALLTSIATIAALGLLAVGSAQDRTIAGWFVLGALGTFLIFFGAGKLVMWTASKIRGFRTTEFRLALANLHRPGAQTGNVILSLGMGITVLVTVMVVEANIWRQLEKSLPGKAPDYYFIDIQPNQTENFDKILKASAKLDFMERVPILRGRILKVNGADASKVKVSDNKRWVLRSDRGLTWSRLPPPSANIVEGEWWPIGYQGPPLISFDLEAARAMGIGVGDALTIDVLGRPITAKISSLRKINWANLGINFVIIFSPGVIETAPQTQIATVRLSRGVTTDIEKIITDRFRNVTAVRVKDILDAVSELMAKIGWALKASALITLLAGILVLGSAIATAHRQRIYDAVILKVLGAKKTQVASTFLIEYGLLAIATAILAAVIGSGAAWAVVTQVMRAEWEMAWVVLIATVLTSCSTVLLGGIIGTWRALGRKAAPMLRND